MNEFRRVLTIAGMLMILGGTPALQAGEPKGETADLYLKQVKPLLKERCFACHGALKQEANLRLDTAAAIHLGGDSGAAMLPGEKAASSLILERVSAMDASERMPPEHEGEPLSAKQIGILKEWIAQGAHAPADEQPEADPRAHWAFRPVARHAVPVVQNEKWVRNPIDAWIAQRHEQLGLHPQPEATRIELVRRLYLDLIGLPPSSQELQTALTDRSPDWYEVLVDQLLEDPRHGERWARHWMDVWRYSDWWGLGAQLRNSQRHLWHWRDWIVESLNQDLPYDQMVCLMLAGDELVPDEINQLRATGYLARNYYLFNRHQWMEQTVEHVSKGFLGLTMNCAKCHDHKFDPIDQTDFYKMRAFFEPYQVRMEMIPGQLDLEKDGIPRVFDGLLEAPTYRFVRGDEAKPDQSRIITAGIPNVLKFDEVHPQQVDLPGVAWEPARRPGVLESYLEQAAQKREAVQTRLAQAEKKLKELESLQQSKPVDTQEPAASLTHSELVFRDEFQEMDASRWQAVQGKWSVQSGLLEQKEVTPQQSLLRLLTPAPVDFEAKVRFRITGGARWKSVGLSFDASPTGNEAAADVHGRQMVYVSGAAEDSKVQAAYQQGGKWNYPPAGRAPLPIQLNQDYMLIVRVRGTLVNALLNDQPLVAWQMSLPREPGLIHLLTYDASATFQEFSITPLGPQVAMQPAGNAPAMTAEATLEEARYQLHDAKLAVTENEAAWLWTQSVVEAMRAEWDDPESSLTADKRIVAIRAERARNVAQQERKVAAAEHVLQQAPASDQKKRDAAEKGLKSAQDGLKQSQEKLVAEITAENSFSRLSGGTWSATRFQHTGHDDPEVKFPHISTGRRTALAQWITDPRNPLTARVAVNHLWGRHFGEPLVATTFDFGRNGAKPTHPELLDWLAIEFMEQGWSMKHLHRLIVTSSAYRMTSSIAGGESALAADPENCGLWRRVPVRLESQVVRDSVLSLAGTLDPTMGGPPVPMNQQETSHRRSLYFFHSNNERNLFLTTFDEASVSECYRREQSIVPQQALALSNSQLVQQSAVQIADRISGLPEVQGKDDTAFVRGAFQLVTGIEPGPAEITASLAALNEWSALPGGNPKEARASFIWVLINHNDFVTLR